MKKLLILLCFFNVAYGQTLGVASQGAFGNNGNDEGQKIQNALNFASQNGYVRVDLDVNKTYLTSINIKVPSNIEFNGSLSTIKPTAGMPAANAFLITNASVVTHSANAVIAVTKGSKTFSYSGAAAITPGQTVMLYGPQYYVNGKDSYEHGFYGEVESSSGNTVILKNAASETFAATSIKEYSTAKNIRIRNVILDLSGRTAGRGIGLTNVTSSLIEGCTVKGNVPVVASSPDVGIFIQGVGNLITKCRSYGMQGSVPGYAFSIQGHNNTVSYSRAWAARHTITSAQGDFYSTQQNFLYDTVSNDGGGTGTLLDWHPNTYDSRAEGCVGIISGINPIGIAFRGKRDSAINNTITAINNNDKDIGAFALFENCDAPYIANNTVVMSGNSGSNYFLRTYGGMAQPPSNIQISNNLDKGGTLTVNAAIGKGMRITGNDFRTNDGYKATITLSGSTPMDYFIDNNTFVNDFGGVYNYVVSTPDVTANVGVITNNDVYTTSASNVKEQIRINNNGNTVTGNTLYRTGSSTKLFKYNTGHTNINTGNTIVQGGTPVDTDAGAGEGTPPEPLPENAPLPAPPPCDNCSYYFIRLAKKQ